MKLTPLFDFVIVKQVDKETIPGIILPDTISADKPDEGEVLAIGDGKVLSDGTRSKMTVKVGDKILFKKYSPDEIKIDGINYLIISESDVLAIL
jgi:chaperonin GroES